MTLTIRDYKLPAMIGIHPHEHERAQDILIQARLQVSPLPNDATDQISSVLSYSQVRQDIKMIIDAKHYELIETLVHDLVNQMQRYKECLGGWIKVEKLEAYPDAVVGIEMSFGLDKNES